MEALGSCLLFGSSKFPSVSTDSQWQILVNCNMCPKILTFGENGLNSKLKHRICSKRAFYPGELVTCMGDQETGAIARWPVSGVLLVIGIYDIAI